MEKSRIALADAFVASRTIAEALESRVKQLAGELAAAEADHARVAARLKQAQQSRAVASAPVNIIRLLWESGEREQLRRVLDALIARVVVRLDEVLVELAVPLVCETKRKSAPTGIEPVSSP